MPQPAQPDPPLCRGVLPPPRGAERGARALLPRERRVLPRQGAHHGMVRALRRTSARPALRTQRLLSYTVRTEKHATLCDSHAPHARTGLVLTLCWPLLTPGASASPRRISCSTTARSRSARRQSSRPSASGPVETDAVSHPVLCSRRLAFSLSPSLPDSSVPNCCNVFDLRRSLMCSKPRRLRQAARPLPALKMSLSACRHVAATFGWDEATVNLYEACCRAYPEKQGAAVVVMLGRVLLEQPLHSVPGLARVAEHIVSKHAAGAHRGRRAMVWVGGMGMTWGGRSSGNGERWESNGACAPGADGQPGRQRRGGAEVQRPADACATLPCPHVAHPVAASRAQPVSDGAV